MFLHQHEEHFVLIFHELLVLFKLGDRVQEGNDTLVEVNLLLVCEVDHKGIVDSLTIEKLGLQCESLNIHDVIEAEEGVDVDTRLEVLADVERILYELYSIGLEDLLMSVGHQVNSLDHL